jgi:hypothetical protein
VFERLDFVYLPSRDAAADVTHFTDAIGGELVFAELQARGAEIGARFEIPMGPGVELVNTGPQRLALYQPTRPGTLARLTGRRDF